MRRAFVRGIFIGCAMKVEDLIFTTLGLRQIKAGRVLALDVAKMKVVVVVAKWRETLSFANQASEIYEHFIFWRSTEGATLIAAFR